MKLFVASVAALLLLAFASTASASISPNPFGGRTVVKPAPFGGRAIVKPNPFGGRKHVGGSTRAF